MTRSCSLLLRTALLGMLVIALFAASASRAGKPVIALFISSQRVVRVGAPVVITVVLTNRSHHSLVIEREVSGTDCQIEVRDDTGKLVPETKFGLVYNGHVEVVDMSGIDPHDLNRATVNIAVKPKRTLSWGVDVTRFYRMDRPGTYWLSVQRLDPEDPALPWVKSNTIEVSIIP